MNQNGRSMIEMLGVLAIVGVLSVGGIAGYSKAMSKYRTNKTIEQITQIVSGVRTFYDGQRNYAGLDGSVLRKAKILPESAFESSTSNDATNPFGGLIEISFAGKNVFDDKKAFVMHLGNIPEDACIEILTQDWGGASSGLIAIGVESDGLGLYGCTGYGTFGGGKYACADKLPLSVTDAMDFCAKDDGSAVIPAFKFY